MPEISIIVPVYNVEKKIRRCIDSILAQTFTDFELILVNDGSSDKSGEICDEYANSRIKVIHQSNKGAASARNRGIEEACGKYIGFVDSDDYLAPTFLSTLFEIIETNQADMAMCNLSMIADGEVTCTQDHGFSDGTFLTGSDIQDIIYRNIYNNSNTAGYFSLCNKLFKKSIIEKNNIRIDQAMSFGEDMLFVMHFLKHCDSIAFSSQVLYYYEQTPGGLFSKYRTSFIDDIMKCYIALAGQTKPYGSADDECIPLSLKYWYYISRHIQGAIKNEKKINAEIKRVLSRDDVKTLLCRIASLTDEQAKERNIEINELKMPRSVALGKITRAVIIARYQFDENYWLRKLKRRLTYIRGK